VLGLFIRLFVLDDAMYELIQVVPPWLATWSCTQGWIGVAREEMALEPWLLFYVQDGHAYVGKPGGTPTPLLDGSPPFYLESTADREVE
jgi:hypothetical protein